MKKIAPVIDSYDITWARLLILGQLILCMRFVLHCC